LTEAYAAETEGIPTALSPTPRRKERMRVLRHSIRDRQAR
jgi:hypothetical protein